MQVIEHLNVGPVIPFWNGYYSILIPILYNKKKEHRNGTTKTIRINQETFYYKMGHTTGNSSCNQD